MELYDDAFKEKMEGILNNFLMAPPESAFNRSKDDSAKVKLPLVSGYRINSPVNFDQVNSFEVFTGRVTRKGTSSSDIIREQGIPVTLIYQIDIWSDYRYIADGIYRELVYYMMRNPNLSIQLPEMETPYEFSMRLTDVDSPTEYGDFSNTNVIHRYTLTYEIDNARMFFHTENLPQIEDPYFGWIDIFKN